MKLVLKQTFLLSVAATFLLFSSCEIKKRGYRNGFYINGFNIQHFAVKEKTTAQKMNAKIPKPGTFSSETKKRSQQVSIGNKPLQISSEEKLAKQSKRSRQLKIDQKIGEQGLENKLSSIGDTTKKEVDYFELQKVKTRSIASFILGISSLVTLLYYIGFLLAIIGILLAVSAIRKSKKIPYPVKKIRFAKIGLTLSIIGSVLGLGYLIIYLIFSGFL
jgi:hypothetical protein